MTSRRSGFSLLEVIVVLAVVGILVGSAIPLVNVSIDRQRSDKVEQELVDVSQALQDFFFDNGAFPPALDSPGFLGIYLFPGIEETGTRDGWGANVDYVYSLSVDPDIATVRSRGPNGQDDSGTVDDIQAIVPGAVAGNRKTRQRMRIIVEALANFMESGGLLTGTWATDRANLGLGASYGNDGFGTPFRLLPATFELESAGADRSFGTADDLTF